MKWTKYTVKTTTQAEDMVCDLLVANGITGIEIEDNIQISENDRKAMYIDILPVLPDDKETAYVSFYIAIEDGDLDTSLLNNGITIDETKSIDVEKLINSIRNGITELSEFVNVGEATITETVTEDSDWANNWKEFFKPFMIEGFLIKPTWEQTPDGVNENKVVHIDPGTAFGTGQHETTQLCIRGLRKYMRRNDQVLDLGCGSAILSIIAMKLGANHIVATDIDKIAVEASKDNVALNGILDKEFEVYEGDILTNSELQDKIGNGKYDIVVANILADVIILLSPFVHKYLKIGGHFISSGIIYTKEQAVRQAIEANEFLEIEEIIQQGDWISACAYRK